MTEQQSSGELSIPVAERGSGRTGNLVQVMSDGTRQGIVRYGGEDRRTDLRWLRPRYGEASLRIGAEAATIDGDLGVVVDVRGDTATLDCDGHPLLVRIDRLLPEAGEPDGAPAPARIGDTVELAGVLEGRTATVLGGARTLRLRLHGSGLEIRADRRLVRLAGQRAAAAAEAPFEIIEVENGMTYGCPFPVEVGHAVLLPPIPAEPGIWRESRVRSIGPTRWRGGVKLVAPVDRDLKQFRPQPPRRDVALADASIVELRAELDRRAGGGL